MKEMATCVGNVEGAGQKGATEFAATIPAG